MITGCTAIERLCAASSQYAPEIEWMLPSKISPTISARALISGPHELLPTNASLAERLKGLFGSSHGFACSQRSGSLNGSAPYPRSPATQAPPQRLT